MKKKTGFMITAALLSGVLGAAIPAAAATIAQEDIAGTWYLLEMGDDTGSFNMADMGMEVPLVLNEDYSCTMMVPGDEEASEYVYELSENGFVLHADDEDVIFTLEEDGTLVTREEDLAMIYTREKPELTDWEAVLGKTVAEDQELKNFAGTWKASVVSTSWGQTSNIDPSEMEATLVIAEDGTAVLTLTDFFNEDALTANFKGELKGYELILTNTDQDSLLYGYYLDPNLLTLNLHDNGMLENINYSQPSEEGEEPEILDQVYFEKVEETAEE